MSEGGLLLSILGIALLWLVVVGSSRKAKKEIEITPPAPMTPVYRRHSAGAIILWLIIFWPVAVLMIIRNGRR